MICARCGADVSEGSKFCPHCGAAVKAENAKLSRSFFRPGDSLTGRAAAESDKMPEQPYRVSDPCAHCPHCGAKIALGNTFCTACGRCLGAESMDVPRKKRSVLLYISAFAVCIAFIAGIFLLGRTEKSKAEPSASSLEDENASFLCGSWYTYSGGTASPGAGSIAGATAMELHLERTMEAQLIYYVTNSDVYASYTGTWDPTVLSENTAKITLQLVGDNTAPNEEYAEPYKPYNATITVQVDQNSMAVVTETGDRQSLLAGITFERDLTLQRWTERELASGVRKITPEEAHAIYETFFCENYLYTDLVCLADVTHDGLDEMIVVHFPDDQEIDGYVYTIDENKQVNLIFSNIGYRFHAGGYFNWYIRESPTGFILAGEDGYWSTGYGTLAFHEYYLTQDGGVCEISSVSVTSFDYSTDEEISAAFERYQDRVSQIKASLYTIYSCPGNGYDADTIAMHPMTASDIFSVAEPAENAIIGHWTYNHELYGAVGVFAFESDGTGYISVFGNVQYEFTYYVIDNMAVLTIDGDSTICTFERDGDEMYWEMSGETYYLTYREGE